MAKYKFEIKQRLPSFNEYINKCRTNKYAGAKMKKEIEYEIWLYILEQLKGKKLKGTVKVHFTWVEENGKRDLDNVCFAKKFILDALVKAGVLENDNRKYVSGFTDEFEYAKESKVIVELEEEKMYPDKKEIEADKRKREIDKNVKEYKKKFLEKKRRK